MTPLTGRNASPGAAGIVIMATVNGERVVGLAREHGAAAVASWFPPDPAGSWRRNAERPAPARVPEAGLRATLARLRRPGTGDGSEAVRTVRFDGAGGFAVGTDEAAPRAR